MTHATSDGEALHKRRAHVTMEQDLLDSISRDSASELEALVSRGLASLELPSQDIGKLFVYAAFLGSRRSLDVLLHFGKLRQPRLTNHCTSAK